MWQFITSKTKIQECHKLLEKRLSALKHEVIPDVGLAYQAGKEIRDVSYSAELDMWWRFDGTFLDNRYWNPFGIGKPLPSKSKSIGCEINYAKQFDRGKVNLGIAAAGFAANHCGDILLIHSGRIGGGKKGIGKQLFIDNYTGKIEVVSVNDNDAQFFPIGLLNSPRLPQQIQHFVKEVSRIKNIPPVKTTEKKEPEAEKTKDISFNEEFSGRKRFKPSRGGYAECDHGLVVNGLQQLLNQSGKKTGNDKPRDLFVASDTNLIEVLFEFKTGLDTQSIYSGIGQLFLNGTLTKPCPKLVLVVPVGLLDSVQKRITSLGVTILEYQWKGKQATYKHWENKIK